MFTKVLIANRGAIACRIIRTLRKMGIGSVAVYNEADAMSLHVVDADEAYSLGEGNAANTYLNQEKILEIAKQSGAEAIHPGYGFLSENPEFVLQCEVFEIVFLGPTPEQMRAFGLKHSARGIAQKANVPLLPGTGLLHDLDEALTQAELVGYPVMLKSTAGGGGIGMQRCDSSAELSAAFDSVRRLSENNFSNNGIFIEKFIENARHIEVQIFGDGLGGVVALGERDCSAQRRHQKVIEETPAPNLSDATRNALKNTALRLAKQVNYSSAGTVEFVLDQENHLFYFLEVNTRLQVEHGVTEEVFDVDLVEWMIKQGAKELNLCNEAEGLSPQGHAIQVRLYAEDANKAFQPSAGLLSEVQWPEAKGLRIEHWIEAGVEVSPFFDPMLAKVIVHADSRATALENLKQALSNINIYGIEHNKSYLQQLLDSDVVNAGEVLTNSLNKFKYFPSTFDVLHAGTQTTIQDYPGRIGYWDVGVPPSGPMDSVSFRLANKLLQNPADAAALEIVIEGPTLRFNQNTQVAITGAAILAKLDDVEVASWKTIDIKAGQTLKLGRIPGLGARAYLAVSGGIQCPDYLGSKSTFTLGQFGGHSGRALRIGDVLHVKQGDGLRRVNNAIHAIPEITDAWCIRVIYGPHGAPDFFTTQDIQDFFKADWQVHFNSSRTGVRLIGPKPQWARPDGGEAGLHPSNIHDNAYAVGSIDYTGDMPVILGPDGPSLGGFVCPATIIKADLWKMGQLKAGDSVRFLPVSIESAAQAERLQLDQIEQSNIQESRLPPTAPDSAVLKQIDAEKFGEAVVYRPSGEDFLLVEYGPQLLDIRLRFRVHALMLKLKAMAIPGVQELTPGIRSLQIHYDNLALPLEILLTRLETAESELGDIANFEVPARIIHLPLSWDDEATRLAIKKYDEVVRKDAPWCPDNIEFIRRINGLESVEDVKKIVFDASYLVMGLGDVYLGAPVATPLDPRHRLVTTKYNPARTWTPENAVGIGGAYLCVYGMEGPGGYQFVGRTLQMWNRYRQTNVFEKPWLLRFFDQIRFYEVTSDELINIRKRHPCGQHPMTIEKTTFSLGDYKTFLDDNVAEIQQAKLRQQTAFEEERQRWELSGQANFTSQVREQPEISNDTLSTNEASVDSHVAGNIWQVLVTKGQRVTRGDVVMVLEAMKMELQVLAAETGTIDSISFDVGDQVHAGQRLLVINTSTEHSTPNTQEVDI